MDVDFEPATEWGGGIEGLAVLSRWRPRSRRARVLPFGTPQEIRKALLVEVDSPGGSFVFATTHLTHRLGAEEDAKRDAQVLALDAFVRQDLRDRPAVLVGDFNAAPDRQAIAFLCGRAALDGRRGDWRDAWVERRGAEPGWTFAARNPYTDPKLGTDRRIDYVFVSPAVAIGACELILDQPDPSGLFASDHFGVLCEIALP